MLDWQQHTSELLFAPSFNPAPKVSNYPAELLEEMAIYATGVKPAVNQLEFHPRFSSPKLREAAARAGCQLTAYGVMHAVKLQPPPGAAAAGTATAFERIATLKGVSPTQVALAWVRCKGIVAIPRSGNPDHQKENLESLDVELSAEEVNCSWILPFRSALSLQLKMTFCLRSHARCC